MGVKKKWLERKIALTEKEIGKWESNLNSAAVNLRQEKKKLWELMEQLERVELKEGE
ncbi:hypothetical protein ABC228_01045 [Ornithinibacillus sp. 16A2E]|uniref:Uncharacterized protein n=2 Tax=Ornithinibacillus xuwenensis TaxID=3144668 RepID=A0ABU9XCJ0_9BACI